ncbi:RraA family protein [Alicyclobacillus fastidiosus]|uniref:Putative 4-hydroxy-4-methyl-2-oxoglutarate aldolase n=1 Tax=Alicyclobacillus fastidiosus TaxID=392011 RepID=A0ABV5AB78_9BACL|nr:RraA family protein [Alicyclobacillus fastidiosus]WEH10580.1 RraA family protein [Alicyclobacillus fastidiosus]
MTDILQQFSQLSTPTVSDALDRIGMEGACLGITPIDHKFRLIGRAFTLKYEPVGVDKGNVGDFIDDVAPGTIIVIDNGGRLNCTVWGDILTTMASMKGIGGTVIDGVCRDTSLYTELNYPVFSKARYMRTGKDRVQLEAINVPVSLSDIRVCPNDIIFGDADGVVVIPKEHEERVLEIALEIEEAEDQIRSAIKNGMRLDEARKAFKYHSLQSKRGL